MKKVKVKKHKSGTSATKQLRKKRRKPRRPYHKTRLELFKEVCRKYLILKDENYIDAQFGTVFANIHLDFVPVWIYIVGVPGAGKTIIIEAFSDHELIHDVSTITPNTLVSGMKTSDGSDPSLLPKLDGKIMAVKDLTALLKDRHENVHKVMGQLRDAYDGRVRKIYGTGKDDFYESKFGIIAAVTNEIDRHLGLLAPLGERFLLYRLKEASEETAEEIAMQASSITAWSKQKAEMKDAAHNVLNLTVKTIPTLSKSNRREIVKAAMVVRKARGSVERDRRTKEPLYPAHPEAPSRLTQQLCALAQGIAIAREHKVVKPKDIFLAQKIALDSATANRIKTLKILLEEGKVTADLLSEHLDISRSAARIWLHDMEILELLDHVGKKHSKNQRWWLKEEYVELLHKVWNANNADEGRC